jgi:hypothetical protein
VQVQKLFFLIDRNIAGLVDGPHFAFTPYHYGPFDKDVYEAIRALEREDLADFVPERTWTNYRLTVAGQAEGKRQLNELPPEARDYIGRVSEFVLALSFTQLVSAIYSEYPEMRANSVFQR